MQKLTTFVTVSLLLITTLFVAACQSSSEGKNKKLEKRLGKEAIDTLKAPDDVFIFSVDPTQKENYNGKEPLILLEESNLTDSQKNSLKMILLNDSSYDFEKTKKCVFVPEIGFRFKKEYVVTVLVSLNCNQMRFLIDEGRVTLDFDPINEEMAKLTREILAKPNNK